MDYAALVIIVAAFTGLAYAVFRLRPNRNLTNAAEMTTLP
jgi:hypothetical protein